MLASHEASQPTAAPTVLIRVAFATTRHADEALGMIVKLPDLFARAKRHRCPSSHDEMGMVDVFVAPEKLDRVKTLAIGLHGIVVRERHVSTLTVPARRQVA